MKIKDFDLSVIKHENELWCDFTMFYCISKNMWTPNIYPIMKSIGKNYFYKQPNKKDKRRCFYFINSDGLTRYFALSRSIPLKDIKEYISLFNSNGFHVKLEKTSKEYEFDLDLENILSAFNCKIERQKSFCLSYGSVLVDFFINDYLCIEYDENNHASYDKEKELKRETELKQKGFKFLRITDKKSNTENIAIILKEMKKWKQK